MLAGDPSSALPWVLSQFWRHPTSLGMKGFSSQGPSSVASRCGGWNWKERVCDATSQGCAAQGLALSGLAFQQMQLALCWEMSPQTVPSWPTVLREMWQYEAAHPAQGLSLPMARMTCRQHI